jgi:arginyl-tRNA synthetase
VITGDLSAAVAGAVAAAVAAGDLDVPPTSGYLEALATGRPVPSGPKRPGTSVAQLVPPGTWRPVPPAAGGGPGHYATTIPFVLAGQTAADPGRIAALLADRLRARPEISRVEVTGRGYLSITVTGDALARLAVRISQAGARCAHSQALAGVTVAAVRDARLPLARTWPEAHQRLGLELAGRLAAAAGAELSWLPAPAGRQAPATTLTSTAATSPVADAIAFAGEDAIRFTLSGMVPGAPGPAGGMPPIDPHTAAEQHLGHPAYAVRYAHAHAASAVRQAADLGLFTKDAERFQPCLLADPGERALLDAMSWLPERVAGAARRGQPQVLVAFLEDLAGKYLDGREGGLAMQPGAVRQPGGGPLLEARLWLADAARTALGAGLGLLGMAAPERL